ncbi:MAG: hypothetical protein U5K84_03945 [Alkalibacterium sp.]|nr:hypothetical protein [Alkalibacterium sp.]
MEGFTQFLFVVSLIIMMTEVIGVKKAINEKYDSKFITFFRGWNVAALLERDISDDRVKKLLLIHNGLNPLILLVINYFYFSGRLYSDYSFAFTFSVLLIWSYHKVPNRSGDKEESMIKLSDR